MKLTFRWYGLDDPVKLKDIKQIPGMEGIVTAIYDVPVGETWPLEKIKKLQDIISQSGLTLEVIESVPVHEDIKFGLPSKEKYIENYKQTIKNLSQAGIKTVCYNFMPVFDWTRSALYKELEDSSLTMAYEHDTILKMDPVSGELGLPGWATTDYAPNELEELLERNSSFSSEDLWANLEHFLKEVVPIAEKEEVKLAIHPDDPPWSVFGLPRIITSKENLERLINIVDSPCNGLTICTGSLGANRNNNIPEIMRYFANKKRINFVHFRNIKFLGQIDFEETAHLSENGSLDMYEIMKACVDGGFDGPIRPDHGRMIWGEEGRPGYGLYDRALGATYINGLLEAIIKGKKNP